VNEAMDERTACKVFIKEVMERELQKDEQGREYIEVGSQPVSTVRVMGVVVSRSEGERYTILTLDDSTETISVRAFGEDKDKLEGVEVGETIDVIGTLTSYEEERYILPRVVAKVEDPNWEIVRRLEILVRRRRKGSLPVEEVVEGDAGDESELKTAVLQLIEKLDTGDGAEYAAILRESTLESAVVDRVLSQLLSDSEIYEPKIGRFRKV